MAGLVKMVPLGSSGLILHSGPFLGVNDDAVDLTGYTVTCDFYAPGSVTAVTRSGTLNADNTIQYTTTTSDLDELGRWVARLYATQGTAVVPGPLFQLHVHQPWELA